MAYLPMDPTGTRKRPLGLNTAKTEMQQLQSGEVLEVFGAITVATTDGDLMLAPHGTGALRVSNAGNARGDYAVDLQRRSTLATQVPSGFGSGILGGVNNTVSGTASVICGGSTNVISGQSSVIVGGFENTISGNYSSIINGQYHTVSAYGCTIIGGAECYLRHYGSIGHSSGMFEEVGDAQRQVNMLRCVTSATDQEELFLDGDSGSYALTLVYGDVVYYTIKIMGTKKNTQTSTYCEKIEGIITRTAGGTQHVAGPTVIRTFGASLGTITVDDPDHWLRIQVTPNTEDEVWWCAVVDMLWVNGYVA